MNPMTDAAHNYGLRHATQHDLAPIKKLLAGADLPLDGIEKCFDSMVVAERDNRIIGVAAVEDCGNVGLLRSVAVDSTERGTGVGRAVVEGAIETARADGYDALYLLTTTAAKYFPVFGFENADRDSAPESIRNNIQFKELCPSTATLMWMPLE